MNKKNIIAVSLVILALIFIQSVFTNTTGGVSGLIKIVGVGGAILTFFKPRIGIYIITVETCYLDYFKKLGTYHGTASQLTVIEILSMSMLTIGMLWLSMILTVGFTRFKLNRTQWNLIIGIVIVAVMLIAIGGLEAKALQDVVNGAGILGITLAITLYYDNPSEQAIKYLRHLLFILLPWPIMGLYQYYFDYSLMDYWYNSTSLSVTNKPLEELTIYYGFRPPLGFASNAYAFACVGGMYGLSLWHAIAFKVHRKKYLAMFIFCFITILHTEARTAMILPLLIIIFFLLLKNKILTMASLIGFTLVIFTVIICADSISRWIDENNTAFMIEGYESKMTLNTLQARLVPLMELRNTENWSLIGVASLDEIKASDFGERFYSHNFLTKILYSTGIVGLSLILIPCLIVFSKLFRFLGKKRDNVADAMTRYSVAYLLPFITLNLLGGTGISTQPGNLIMGTAVMLLVCANMNTKEFSTIDVERSGTARRRQ